MHVDTRVPSHGRTYAGSTQTLLNNRVFIYARSRQQTTVTVPNVDTAIVNVTSWSWSFDSRRDDKPELSLYDTFPSSVAVCR